MYPPEWIDVLSTHGIDFQRHEDMGIDPDYFAELMITSGLVLADDTKWISFHRCVAYCPLHSDSKRTRADGSFAYQWLRLRVFHKTSHGRFTTHK